MREGTRQRTKVDGWGRMAAWVRRRMMGAYERDAGWRERGRWAAWVGLEREGGDGVRQLIGERVLSRAMKFGR